MIKKISFFLFIITIYSNCSFDTRSGIWTQTENIKKEASLESKSQILFEIKKIDTKELNQNLIIKTPLKTKINYNFKNDNNSGPLLTFETFKKKSKYKFSKIKNFENFSYDLIFDKDNLIFFDKNGTIIKFNDNSKIIWKKNFYSKQEKKSLPILNFSTNGKILIVNDNLSKYYALNLTTGEIIWDKSHETIFISKVKIDKDKFFAIDSNNNIFCFNLIDGKKIWSFNTENLLIKSQKKLSIVLDDKKLYFNNSNGDIYSLDKNSGRLVWLIPLRNTNISFKSFLHKSSNLVLDNDSLYFSNNQNAFFSLDKNNGVINWKQNVSSYFTTIIAKNLIFTVNNEGYLFVIDKRNGNIVRINDLFKNLSKRKRSKIKISGFVLSNNAIYLSLNNGKILEANIGDGKQSSILNVGGNKLSKPFINNKQLFIIKNNEIVKIY